MNLIQTKKGILIAPPHNDFKGQLIVSLDRYQTDLQQKEYILPFVRTIIKDTIIGKDDKGNDIVTFDTYEERPDPKRLSFVEVGQIAKFTGIKIDNIEHIGEKLIEILQAGLLLEILKDCKDYKGIFSTKVENWEKCKLS